MAADHVDTSFVLTNAPGWLAYVAVLIAGALAWWAWRRYGPPPPGVAGTIAKLCRCAALILLVAIVAGPAWRVRTVSVEPGVLGVAIDTSASMQRADGPGDQPRIALADDLGRSLRERLADRPIRLVFFRFDAHSEPVSGDQLGELSADGARSVIGDNVARLATAGDLDALVVLSDGRVTHGSQLPATGERLTRLGQPRAGVWALAVGSERIDPQLRLEEVEIAREVPLGERVPVRLRIAGRALGEEPIRATLRRGDEVLAELTIDPPRPDEDDPLGNVTIEETVHAVLDEQGEQELSLRVESGELADQTTTSVVVQERQLQILLLADRPRYEMRYLRAALARDYTVTVHTYLAEGRWRLWGDESYGPQTLPLEPGTIADYDAIILGDLPADRFSPTQLQVIEDHVREDGAGLIWVPGAKGAVATYENTPLGGLLPVRIGDVAATAAGYTDNVERHLLVTDTARSLSLLTLAGENWSDLPTLRTGASVLDLVPGASVLATDQAENPLVVSRNFGGGRAIFIGTDDTWRWRRNAADSGDFYLHRFYSQLLRYASAGRGQGDQDWRVVATPHRAQPGELIQVGVVPTGAGGDLAALPRTITLRLRNEAGEQKVFRAHRPEGEHGFLVDLPAPAAGTWTAEVADGLDPDAVIDTDLVILPPSDELRDPRRDLAALEDLTSRTGGKLFDANAIAAAGGDPAAHLASALPSLSHERESTRIEPLWDRWWIFALLLALFAVEWALRRWNRLP